MKARCMKCKDERDMKDAKISMTARGGFMAKGPCKQCGCNMCKILSKDNAEKAVKAGDAKKDW